jgi:hypothetical protein
MEASIGQSFLENFRKSFKASAKIRSSAERGRLANYNILMSLVGEYRNIQLNVPTNALTILLI